MAYVRPIPSLDPARPSSALPLAGGVAWFDRVELLQRDGPPRVVPVSEVPDDVVTRLSAPRAPLARLDLSEPRLMGILNVTPDSFSDGGRHAGAEAALSQAKAMVSEGADVLDIGGESTRPGASEVPIDEEIARTVPVITSLRQAGLTTPISLDTRKAAVAEAGLAAGGDVINDVSGLRFDPGMAALAADRGAPVVLMHSIGSPEDMQDRAAEAYDDVVLDVYDALNAAIQTAEAAGVDRSRIVVDPGIGFGKTQAQNLALLARLSLFHGLGCAILLGVSRKGFIGAIGGEGDAAKRDVASAGVGLWALSQGVQILRVHDIKTHVQAVRLWRASQMGHAG